MYTQTAIPSREQVERTLPDAGRRVKGPYAVFECWQEIPCDPCHQACNRGAVKAFNDINHLPAVDHEQCNGCARCVSRCPGLAVFAIDETYSDGEALIKLPYEYVPLPSAGQEVQALDRSGQPVGKGRVVKVQQDKESKTPVVWLAVGKKLVHEVRNIGVGGQG